MRIILITGGARSGKSSFALTFGERHRRKALIATAEALDEEMKERIAAHKRQRGPDWETIEEPLGLVKRIEKIISNFDVIVVDCLGLWVSNLLLKNRTPEEEFNRLLKSLKRLKKQGYENLIVFVTNEVGLGIVPGDKLTRQFRDSLGLLNQMIASLSDEVYLVVSGIPLKIKNP